MGAFGERVNAVARAKGRQAVAGARRDVSAGETRAGDGPQPRQLRPLPGLVIMCAQAEETTRRDVRRFGLGAALAALVIVGGCGGRVSGDIGRACMSGGRNAASPQLCSCIQGVANQSLSGSDQRRAAQFFENPDVAQQTRASDRGGDEAFWLRYRAFADRAAAICG